MHPSIAIGTWVNTLYEWIEIGSIMISLLCTIVLLIYIINKCHYFIYWFYLIERYQSYYFEPLSYLVINWSNLFISWFHFLYHNHFFFPSLLISSNFIIHFSSGYLSNFYSNFIHYFCIGILIGFVFKNT